MQQDPTKVLRLMPHPVNYVSTSLGCTGASHFCKRYAVIGLQCKYSACITVVSSTCLCRVSSGQNGSTMANAGGASASSVLSQAYRQPSKIPRLASASSISQQPALPVRQGSRGTVPVKCCIAWQVDSAKLGCVLHMTKALSQTGLEISCLCILHCRSSQLS